MTIFDQIMFFRTWRAISVKYNMNLLERHRVYEKTCFQCREITGDVRPIKMIHLDNGHAQTEHFCQKCVRVEPND